MGFLGGWWEKRVFYLVLRDLIYKIWWRTLLLIKILVLIYFSWDQHNGWPMLILNSVLTLLIQQITSSTFFGPLTLTPRQIEILLNILQKVCWLDLMSSIWLNLQVNSNRFHRSFLSQLKNFCRIQKVQIWLLLLLPYLVIKFLALFLVLQWLELFMDYLCCLCDYVVFAFQRSKRRQDLIVDLFNK